MDLPAAHVAPNSIRDRAGELDRGGDVVLDRSFDVADTWERLGASYSAPEGPQLVAVLRPVVVSNGQGTAAVMTKVSAALTTFADAAEPLVAQAQALASADLSDPAVQADIARVNRAYADIELACADAIRASINHQPTDVSRLPQFTAPPTEPSFYEWLLFSAQAAEFADGLYGAGRNVRSARKGGPIEPGVISEPPEIPQDGPQLPPAPVPVGGVAVTGAIGADALAVPGIAVGAALVTGQYVPDPNDPDHRPPPAHIRVIERDGDGHIPRLNGAADPNTRYVVDHGDYIYETDAKGRVVHAEGELDVHYSSDNQVRDAAAQRRINVAFPPDHAGHVIGAQFGGPGEDLNLVAQSPQINNAGEWKSAEGRWRAAIKSGHEVRVKIDVGYVGDSTRPSGFSVGEVISSGTGPDPQFSPGQEVSPRRDLPNPGPKPR